ncbi:hypothetical protein RQP46_002494 [Phenoliferia psychrophenolica]
MVSKIWLDCDPGRDDAIAILLALHTPGLDLVGISSVHGNSSIENMTYNAVRLLTSFGSPAQSAAIPVVKGAGLPLIRHLVSQASVHGADGLGGVEGLLDRSHAQVKAKLAEALEGNAVVAIAKACGKLAGGEKMTLVATGAFTNAALFVSCFPELAKAKLDSIVCMGGAEGRGNKSPVAEANACCDPHAASILFNFDIKVVICPLNLTHTALFTPEIHAQLLQPSFRRSSEPFPTLLPPASTPLRHTLSTNLIFFAEAYRLKYNFPGPPLHDALTVAFISHPELFSGTRYRVDVVMEGIAAGATVVDLWEYQKETVDQTEENWGRDGKNVFVLEKVNVAAFWDVFLDAVEKSVYRAQIFGTGGEITKEVKVVRTREPRDEKVGVQAILRAGTMEVGMLHAKENWACWSCGEKSTRLRTKHTKVSGVSGIFDILAWVFPLCSSNHACEAGATECLEAIESEIAHSPEEEDFRAKETDNQIEAWRIGIVQLLERDRKSAECQRSDWKLTHKYECLLHRDSPFRGIEAGHPNLSNLSIPMHLSGNDVSHLLFLWVMHHHALLVLAASSKLVSEHSPTALLHILVAIPSCQTLALGTHERLSNEPRPIFYPVTWETIDFAKLREEKDALLMLLKERAASGSNLLGEVGELRARFPHEG